MQSYLEFPPTGASTGRMVGLFRYTYQLANRTLVLNKSKLPLIVPYARTVPDTRWFSMSSPDIPDEFSYVCEGAGTLDDVITRSKRSSDIQNNVAPGLPEVARIPTRKRTYHINHEDLETRMRPLLSCHWHIGRVANVVDDLQVFSLNKLFSFKDFRSAVEFFDALVDIQDEEDHHARVTVDYSNIYIATHTHVAYKRTSDTVAEPKPTKVPGLTARDIRFAVKVETLHGTFLDAGRAVTKVPFDSASLQVWSMEQLRRRYSASHGQETGRTSTS